jgi:phospholipid transport system transporter-binding protein
VIERDSNRLRVRGPVTISNVTALCEAGKQQFPESDVVVDLAEVSEVDSAALSLLFEWEREARRRNARIVFENLPASLKTLATLYGVLELIPTNDRVEGEAATHR